MFDYRLFYPDSSISDDRRLRQLHDRCDKRIYQLPSRRATRTAGRR